MVELGTKTSVKQLIKQLKNKEIYINQLPEEYKDNKEILKAERKYGLRTVINSGYDELRQNFFVNEFVLTIGLYIQEEKTDVQNRTFECFEEYYNYLLGDIYQDNTCYVGYEFKDAFSQSLELDFEKLYRRNSFLENETVDDLQLNYDVENQVAFNKYSEGEKNKEVVKEYIRKIEECKNVKDLQDFKKQFETSELNGMGGWRDIFNISFFFWEYIYKDINDENRFKTIMDFFSKGEYPERIMIKEICSIYDADKVLENYDYSSGSKQTIYKYKRKLREYVEDLKNGDVTFVHHGGFNKTINYYYIQKKIIRKKKISGRIKNIGEGAIYRFYESFDEFAEACQNDLRNCDLTGAIQLDVDLDKYITDETTILPNKPRTDIKLEELSVVLEKKYTNNHFWVMKHFYKNDVYIDSCQRSFKYFFNYVAYLKRDLSGADLLYCEQLDNIKDYKSINFNGAILSSYLNEKFGQKYEKYASDDIESFDNVIQNEVESEGVLNSSRDIVLVEDEETHELVEKIQYSNIGQSVNYITDIHLIHKIKNAKCKSREDIILLINKIVKDIRNGLAYDWQKNINADMLLIGGDVSSDFDIFELFLKELKKEFSSSYRKTCIIFVLGNHELWPFPGLSVNEIVEKYRKLIEAYGMILLHNDLFYKNENDEYGVIKYDELIRLEEEVLYSRLNCTRLAILGGLGFSGYNKEFNANNGIYRNVLGRKKEIEESKTFEKLYQKLVPVLKYTNTIIYTHMPKSDWTKDKSYIERFVYVNGHTHRNDFHDDGIIRIYADNQSGYKSKSIQMKNFSIENEFDYFARYEDGIYEITSQQYNDFYRGKNIVMDFKRKVDFIYMLKRNGYYCFILRNKSGKLNMLNGGALKALQYEDINYYYNNMEREISIVSEPLEQYTEYQLSIASEIRKIGGWGYIHGCIIDIDFNNHIYVNPIDLTVTAYWALDMIDKIAYPSIAYLLKLNCPLLYTNYQKYISGKKKNELIIQNSNSLIKTPMAYNSTDIYKASREIKKMQRLESNILSVWYELADEKSLPQKR